MCTIAFSYKQHPDYPLLMAANRDEFLARPTKSLHWWEDSPILGGLDLLGGGTWFGIHKNGRFATLTNHRSFPLKEGTPSRGDLVKNFLQSQCSPQEYLNTLVDTGPDYNGFNLLFGYADDLWYYGNKGSEHGPVSPGMHGLSNALLDSSWPKVESVVSEFEPVFASPNTMQQDQVFELLYNKRRYTENLPDTGIGPEKEHVLSALFIETEGYGTRASWMLKADKEGNFDIAERSYAPQGEASFAFTAVQTV